MRELNCAKIVISRFYIRNKKYAYCDNEKKHCIKSHWTLIQCFFSMETLHYSISYLLILSIISPI